MNASYSPPRRTCLHQELGRFNSYGVAGTQENERVDESSLQLLSLLERLIQERKTLQCSSKKASLLAIRALSLFATNKSSPDRVSTALRYANDSDFQQKISLRSIMRNFD